MLERAEEFAGKIRRIEKCTADVVYGIKSMTTPPEKAQAAVLQLMGVLERALRAITPDQSAPFYQQVEAHATKFSDTAGIVDARRVRNAVAHGETVSTLALKRHKQSSSKHWWRYRHIVRTECAPRSERHCRRPLQAARRIARSRMQ